MRIGDAAARLGIESHVLRHWEDVGLLHPARSASGHRVYDDELVTRARLIRLCQRAGMSLAEIRLLGPADRASRARLVATKRTQIQATVTELNRADDFLAHLLACKHPVVSQCPECSTFARAVR